MTSNYAKWTPPIGETRYYFCDQEGLAETLLRATQDAEAHPRQPQAEPPRVAVFLAEGAGAHVHHVICGSRCPPRDSAKRCPLAGQVASTK